jgi:tetratricopeptide (TPR) repeat protein
MTFYAQGGNLRPQFQNSLVDCSNALKADSMRADSMSSHLSIHAVFGEFLMVNGEDPRPEFEKAVEIGKTAVRLDPKNGSAYFSMGTANMNRGDYELNHGINPVASYQESIRNYETAIQYIREPDYGYAQLASALQSLGAYEMYKGKDSTPALIQAIENYEKALKINPIAPYYNNLGITNINLAYFQWKMGKDPTRWLKQSEEAYRQAVKSNPDLVFPHNNLGHNLVAQAEYGIRTGTDPKKLISEAIEKFDLARKMNPNYFNAYWDAAMAYRILDEYDLVNGRKPSRSNQIEPFLKKAEELRPDMYFVFYEKAMMHLQAARFQLAERNSPEHELELAKRNLDQAIKLNAGDSDVYLALANCWKVRALWKHINKQDFTREMAEGIAAADKALANFASSSNAYIVRGVLYTLKSDYGVAAKEFEKALAIDSYILPEDRVYFEQANKP